MPDVTVKPLSPKKRGEWTKIASTVTKSAPQSLEVTEEILNAIRAEIIAGIMCAWEFSTIGVILTTIVYDKILNRKGLLVYAAAAYDGRSLYDWEWALCFEKVRAHALSKGCTYISCYSSVPRVVQVVGKLGGDVDTRYMSIPIRGNHD